MSGFGNDNFDDNEVDPAAEFLAREQSQLAGLEDDLNPVVQRTSPVPVAPTVNGDGTKLENGIEPPPSSAAAQPHVKREEPEKIKKWREEQRKRLEEKDAEEEKKREEWRGVAKRELEEWYKHHNELILKTKEANRNAEKQFIADVDEIEPGTEWERISKLCDFNPKASRSSRDTSRMRSIILQLKQTPLKKSIN
ncbi:clathrin light chain isoform X2 [Planococcus citri]|uniref:clathrin light chain isoform X2 n=1 Tax=Planococcus citri TaxID=170843 RepID=UPI0031F8E49F